MLRTRLHGRGGHGLKTASRVLGSALFLDGFEVQDSPRYGAERRGAPLAAYVRAATAPILERGVIERPDLVVIADASLLETPAAAVLAGVSDVTTTLIRSDRDAAYHRTRHGIAGPVWVLPAGRERAAAELRFLGVECAGAAARLLGVSRVALERAVRSELPSLAEAAREESLSRALAAYEHLAAGHGSVSARSDTARASADWIDLPLESAAFAAPAIHAGGTSALQPTGLWRTLRPVVDPERCHHCHWICGTLCPDGVIAADESGRAVIDLEHCKGCMICLAQCPWQAISAVPEQEGAA